MKHIGFSGARRARAAGAAIVALLMAMPSAPALSQGATAAAAATRLPVVEFFRTPLSARPVLSPNGRYVAMAVTQGSGRTLVSVIDLEGPLQPRPVGAIRDSDVNHIWWVNDDRLVFDTRSVQDENDIRNKAPGLWAVNRDASDMRQLIRADYEEEKNTGSRVRGKDSLLDWDWRMYQTLGDGSSDIVVAYINTNGLRETTHISLSRLDTRTGRATPLTEGAPAAARGWLLDDEGKPAAAITDKDGRYGLYTRAADAKAWQLWEEGDSVRSSAPDALWISPQRELFLVQATAKGTSALFRVAPGGTRSDAQPLVQLDGYDFRGDVIHDEQSRRLLGARFETDAPGTVWFDAKMQAVQKAVDAQLPNTVNQLHCRRCEASPRLLIEAVSDQQPAVYYVYNRETQRVTGLFPSHPWLQGKPMAERDMQRFKARDGLSVPVLLTWPVGKPKGPQPAVVLVHGGPWVRGTHWQWEPEAQFLASRGYMVIEPEFRGSTGYGHPHFRAGWKQWGLAMQDDVADAVDWAVKQGWVDAKRVCIAGASYGGYAALMGVVRYPAQYKCAINWVGVTDIDLMYSIHWSDTEDQWRGYGMPVLVGDRAKDAAQLKETSPIRQADKVSKPVLMAYGGSDRRVPLKHGEDFLSAVTRTNADVEWVVYPDEGHGWRKLETKVDFWSRAEKFLARHIGPGAAKTATP